MTFQRLDLDRTATAWDAEVVAAVPMVDGRVGEHPGTNSKHAIDDTPMGAVVQPVDDAVSKAAEPAGDLRNVQDFAVVYR